MFWNYSTQRKYQYKNNPHKLKLKILLNVKSDLASILQKRKATSYETNIVREIENDIENILIMKGTSGWISKC